MEIDLSKFIFLKANEVPNVLICVIFNMYTRYESFDILVILFSWADFLLNKPD